MNEIVPEKSLGRVRERVSAADETPAAKQMLLALDHWITARTDSTHGQLALVYDAAPRFGLDFVASDRPVVERRAFKVEGASFELEISVGGVERLQRDAKGRVLRDGSGKPIRGKPEIVVPGPREEVVEAALRKVILDDPEVHSQVRDRGPRATIVHRVKIYAVRKELKRLGHQYRTADILEAVDVLARTTLVFHAPAGLKKYAMAYRTGPMLTVTVVGPDEESDETTMLLEFHPVLQSAIIERTYREFPHDRVLALRKPLSRWIARLLLANFTQAAHGGWVNDHGYSVYLSSLFRGGWKRYGKISNNIRQVRAALEELKKHGILDPLKPFGEKVDYSASSAGKTGRRSIDDVCWRLFPSHSIVDSIIRANKVRRKMVELK